MTTVLDRWSPVRLRRAHRIRLTGQLVPHTQPDLGGSTSVSLGGHIEGTRRRAERLVDSHPGSVLAVRPQMRVRVQRLARRRMPEPCLHDFDPPERGGRAFDSDSDRRRLLRSPPTLRPRRPHCARRHGPAGQTATHRRARHGLRRLECALMRSPGCCSTRSRPRPGGRVRRRSTLDEMFTGVTDYHPTSDREES